MIAIVFVVIYFTTCFYLLYRNEKTLKMRLEIIEMCSSKARSLIKDGRIDADWYKIFDNLPSYSKMLLSFKPLRKEEWLSAEDLIYLLS